MKKMDGNMNSTLQARHMQRQGAAAVMNARYLYTRTFPARVVARPSYRAELLSELEDWMREQEDRFREQLRGLGLPARGPRLPLAMYACEVRK